MLTILLLCRTASFFIQFRSSHQRISVKKGVLRNFAKFTGKHLLSTCVFATKFRNCFQLLQLCHCGGLSDVYRSNVFKIFKKRFFLMQMGHCTSIFAQNSLTVYKEIYIIDVLEFCIIIRFCGKLVG